MRANHAQFLARTRVPQTSKNAIDLAARTLLACALLSFQYLAFSREPRILVPCRTIDAQCKVRCVLKGTFSPKNQSLSQALSNGPPICRRYVMAVSNLQSLVSRVATTVVDAGRVVKTTAYRQPRAFLSRVSHARVCMPNRMRGHERLDHEAALAVRTGRSATRTGGLPQRLARSARAISTCWSRPTDQRSSGSFIQRIELPKPCAWGRRFEA